MRIALIATSKTTKLYPIALLKLGAYLKDQGHECKVFNKGLPEAGEYDEAWLSTLFTFEIPDVRGYIVEAKKRGMKVKLGGIASSLMPKSFPGEDIHIGLYDEAEKYYPDYSLLDGVHDYSIAWTSRGCIRKCPFCIVPKIEGMIYDIPDWEKTLNPNPEAKRLLFFDNNWTAKSMATKKRDKEKILKLVDEGRITKIDFNQGIDARLMNEKTADIMEGMPFELVRFAFDDISSAESVKKAITLCAERGHRVFRSYMLYNFEDKPVDFYRRIVIMRELADKIKKNTGLKITNEVFPMRYAPILTENKGRGYIGKYWTDIQKKNIMKIMGCTSPAGMINTTTMQELLYDWGDSEEKFLKMLSYPNINEYASRRAANKRLERFKLRVNK